MIYAERQAWLDKAHSYTRERYAAELPDKLLNALANAPLVDADRVDQLGDQGHGIRKPIGLTPALEEVLALVALGHTNREIAEIRCCAEETVKAEIKRILAVLGAHNRAHAVALWAARGDE